MKIVFFTRYGRLGPSSRIRTFQILENSGLKEYQINSLISDKLLKDRYKNKKYSIGSVIVSMINRIIFVLKRPRNEVFYIEKELLPWLPFWLEKLILGKRKYILDFDDATWHYYDQHPKYLVRFFFKNKIKKLINRATLVFCGNEYLKKYAQISGAKKVVKIPTVIDFKKYSKIKAIEIHSRQLRIVWIGTPATSEYLSVITGPLKKLSKEFDFEFVLIGDKKFRLDGVNIVNYDWSENTEVSLIKSCDIGVMPFFFTKFTEGKCGYKLIQYMACGLSVVATFSGANTEIVEICDGGMVVKDENEWYDSLRMLILNHDLRIYNKTNLPEKIERYYSVDSVVNIWIQSLQNI